MRLGPGLIAPAMWEHAMTVAAVSAYTRSFSTEASHSYKGRYGPYMNGSRAQNSQWAVFLREVHSTM